MIQHGIRLCSQNPKFDALTRRIHLTVQPFSSLEAQLLLSQRAWRFERHPSDPKFEFAYIVQMIGFRVCPNFCSSRVRYCRGAR